MPIRKKTLAKTTRKTPGRRGRPSTNLVPGMYLRGETYWLKFYHEGHCVRQSLGTADLSLAIQKAEIARRTPVLEESGRWAAEVNLYVAERIHQGRLSRMYGRARQYALISEASRMNWVRPQQLSAPLLQAWYEGLRKTQSENTAIGYLAHVRGFCAWLLERGKIRENPAALVKRSRSKATPRKNFCSKEIVRRLIEACTDPELRFVLYCGFHCGMRKGEIVNARPDWFVIGNQGVVDADDKEGVAGRVDIRIRPKGTLYPTDPGWKPKVGGERSVPLTAAFRAFLRSGELALDGPFILEPRKIKVGRSAYRYDFRKPFEELLASCKVVGVTTHDMRRTFASLRVMAGVSLTKVAKWIGDSHEITYKHYSHLAPDRDADIEKGI